MKIEITAKGIYGAPTKENPTGEVAIGTILDVKDEPKAWEGRYRVVSGGDVEGKTTVVNPAPSAYAVVDKTGGWYVITKDGQEVTKNFRQADVEGFDALSEEDKAAFVELNKKDA